MTSSFYPVKIIIILRKGNFMNYQNKNFNNFFSLEKDVLKKQKEFLLQMKKDVKKLEFKIKHPKIAGLKNNIIRNFFISFQIGKIIIPYILTTGISFGAFASFDRTPFIKDDQKKKIEVEKKFENIENVKYVLKEDPIDGFLAIISYFENGEKVKTYTMEHFKEEMLTFKNGTISFSNESFLPPTFSIHEMGDSLQLEPNSYFQIVLYYNDFIIVKESTSSNISFTILFIVITLLANYIFKEVKGNASLFDFEYNVQKIKREYPEVDIEELTKKLEIKKSNYDRLTRS